MRKQIFGIAAVSFLLSLIILLPLSDYGRVFQVSEAREGVVVLEILRTGEYILPLRHARIVPSKPILFHWLGAAFTKLGTSYDVFLLRLPSVLAAAGSITAVALLAFSSGLYMSWVIAAGALLSTYCFLHLAYDGRVDMLCCFFMTAAICWWLSQAARVFQAGKSLAEGLRPGTYAITGVLCGFAVLAKGPIGVVLPGLVLFVVSLYFWGWRGVLALVRPGWLWTLAIGLPWYYLAALSGEDSFISRQLVFENVTRFFGGEGISKKPLWFYFVNFWPQAAPWSLVAAVVLVAYVWRLFDESRKKRFSSLFVPQRRKARFVFTASLLWLVAEILFLSLSSGKRRGYLLVITPALALFVSQLLSVYFSKLNRALRLGFSVWFSGDKTYRAAVTLWCFVVVLCLCFVCLLYSGVLSKLPLGREGVLTLAGFEQAISRGGPQLALFFIASSGLSLFFLIQGRRLKRYAFFGFGAFFLLQLVYGVIVNTALAAKGETHTYEDFANEVMALVPEGETLHFIKTLRDESFDGFFFYYRKPSDIRLPSEGLGRGGYFLARTRWLDALPSPDWVKRIRRVHIGGRMIDEPHERLVLFRY